MILSLNEVEALAAKAARGAGLAWGLAEEVADAAGWLARAGLPWSAPLLALLSDTPRLLRPEIGDQALAPAQSDGWLCPVTVGLLLAEMRCGVDPYSPAESASAFRTPREPGRNFGKRLSPGRLGNVLVGADDLAQPGNGVDAPVVARRVAHPLWLLPFLARGARSSRRPMRVQVDGHVVEVQPAPHGHEGGGRLVAVGAASEIRVSSLQSLVTSAASHTPQAAGRARLAIAPETLQALERLQQRTYVPDSDASRLTGAGAGLTDND